MVPSEQPSGVAARGREGWGWLVGLGCEGGRGRRVSRLQRMYVCIVVNIYVLFGKKLFWGEANLSVGIKIFSDCLLRCDVLKIKHPGFSESARLKSQGLFCWLLLFVIKGT